MWNFDVTTMTRFQPCAWTRARSRSASCAVLSTEPVSAIDRRWRHAELQQRVALLLELDRKADAARFQNSLRRLRHGPG